MLQDDTNELINSKMSCNLNFFHSKAVMFFLLLLITLFFLAMFTSIFDCISSNKNTSKQRIMSRWVESAKCGTDRDPSQPVSLNSPFSEGKCLPLIKFSTREFTPDSDEPLQAN